MERETLEVDVLIIGGGPAGLSAALRLAQLQKAGGAPLSIAVLEKAREAGAHMLSGAVLDPSTLRDLVPDFEARGAPLATPVREDRVYFLTPNGSSGSRSRAAAHQPRQLHHLAEQVREVARRSRRRGRRRSVHGICRRRDPDGWPADSRRADGDRGIGKHDERKAGFESGVDIHAKVTIFADGVRGISPKSSCGVSCSRTRIIRSCSPSASRSCGRYRPRGWPPAP